jgi:glycosyl transferase, family 25
MNVFVINLARASERMTHMRDQFDRLGISFARIEAVDAKSMTAAQLKEFTVSMNDAHRIHSWSPAQIGIFLSHHKAWAEIASGEDAFGAVFEDDVHLSDRIKPLLSTNDWIDRSMDIVRLETTMQSMKLERTQHSEVAGMKLYRVYAGGWGAAGYIVSQKIAAWLACSPPPIYEPVDWFLFHQNSVLAPVLKIFQLDPAPCVQDQYHPDPNRRLNFDRETKVPTGQIYAIQMASRRLLSPLVRRASGRRGVPFA